MPDDVAVEIRDEILASPMFQEYERLKAERKAGLKRREELLEKLAPKVDFKPSDAMHRVAVSYSTTYATQGWGAMKYAKGALLPWADHLE